MKVKVKPSMVPFFNKYKHIQLFRESADDDISAKSKNTHSQPAADGKEDEVITGRVTTKERKKMKLFSKKKSVLFIPSFRKSKRLLSRDSKDRELSDSGPLSADSSVLVRLCDGDNSSVKSSVSSLEEHLSDQLTDSIDSGIDCVHPASLPGLVLKKTSGQRISTSSLPVSKLACDPTLDLGMKRHKSHSRFGHHSQSNITDKDSDGCGRAPIASPEDDSLLDNEDSNSDSDSDLLSPPRKSKVIACAKASNSVHNNSASSFHTLSDSSSCSYNTDSDSDSCDSDSDSERVRRRDRSSDSDSDTDSDASQCSAFYIPTKCYTDTSSQGFSSGSIKRIPVTKGSTLPRNYVHRNCVNTNICTEKRDYNCKNYQQPKDNTSVSSHRIKVDRSVKTSQMRESLGGNLVEDSSFIRSKCNKRSDSFRSGGRSFNSTNGHKPTAVLESPHVLVSPSPKYVSTEYQTDHSITSTPIRGCRSSSRLPVTDRSAFCRWNTTGSLPRSRISYVEKDVVSSKMDEPIYDEIRDSDILGNDTNEACVNVRPTNNDQMTSFGYVQLCAVQKAQPKTVKLKRSVSDISGCDRFSVSNNNTSKSSQEGEEIESIKQTDILCDSKTETQSANSMSCDTTLPLDTSKSVVDVRRAMKKTAFWIENATYDSTCSSEDGSPSSLLKDKKSVSEADLCNQIIDIYFGEESDSSLSSSCLDNSLDQDSSLSFETDENTSPDNVPHSLASPQTIETNIDDYSIATFMSDPYQTSEAKTRRIKKNADHNPKSTVQSSSLKTTSVSKQAPEYQEPNVLKEKTQNTSIPKKVVKEKPIPVLKKSAARTLSDGHPPSLLSEHEVDTITKLHTICNSQRKVSYMDVSKTGMIIKHYPPPKHASRISWCDQLANANLDHHTPTTSPAKTKSILLQRPQSFVFPYVEDEPSPIVITRLRRSKSMSRRKEWPW